VSFYESISQVERFFNNFSHLERISLGIELLKFEDDIQSVTVKIKLSCGSLPSHGVVSFLHYEFHLAECHIREVGLSLPVNRCKGGYY